MNPLFILVAATVFVVVHGISLVAKNETLRGLGRIFLGFALLAYGEAGVKIATVFSNTGLAALCSYVLLTVGVMTIGSGIHKYRRRNVAQ